MDFTVTSEMVLVDKGSRAIFRSHEQTVSVTLTIPIHCFLLDEHLIFVPLMDNCYILSGLVRSL